MSQIAIHCQNLHKSFQSEGEEVHALRGVNLDIYEGEMVLLVGPSGCGKTTLISIIAGILGYDQGVCEVFGRDYVQMNDRDKLKFRGENVGFIFQSFNLLTSLTIQENVAVPLMINGTERYKAMRQAADMLDEVGMADRRKNKPNQLSGGQQQRVAIARALIHSPKLVVCDEPTSALDHTTGMRIMDLMQSLNERLRTTFAVVTHDNRIFQYAHRIAFMDDGVIDRISVSQANDESFHESATTQPIINDNKEIPQPFGDRETT